MGKYRHHFAVEQIGKQPRSKRRLKVFLPVTLEREGMNERAHMLDLSKVGARMHGHVPPLRNEQVTICWGKYEIDGVVAWVQGNGFAVLFTEKLNEADIAAFIQGD
jgi:hypothetical protein